MIPNRYLQQSNISQDGGVAALVSYFILLIFDFSLSLALCGDNITASTAVITTTTTSTVGLVAAYDSWLRSTTTTRNFKLLKMNRTDRLNRTEQIDWLTTSLASYSPQQVETLIQVSLPIQSLSPFILLFSTVETNIILPSTGKILFRGLKWLYL